MSDEKEQAVELAAKAAHDSMFARERKYGGSVMSPEPSWAGKYRRDKIEDMRVALSAYLAASSLLEERDHWQAGFEALDFRLGIALSLLTEAGRREYYRRVEKATWVSAAIEALRSSAEPPEWGGALNESQSRDPG